MARETTLTAGAAAQHARPADREGSFPAGEDLPPERLSHLAVMLLGWAATTTWLRMRERTAT